MRTAELAGGAGVAVGGAVVFGLWMLFERVQRPTLEAKSYVHGIHEASEAWVQNTEKLMEELRQVPEAVAALPELASEYARRSGAG